jgi:hypothetical protein
MKKPLPFSVFKRANRPCYLVAFKNEKTGACLPPIKRGTFAACAARLRFSARKTTGAEAIKTAFLPTRSLSSMS